MAQKTLVITEKPSVGRDIARVLKCKQKINGALEGSTYIVTWGLGHLVTLADPEAYDTDYKEWKLEHLPMIPSQMKLEVMKQTNKQYQAVKTLIHRHDIDKIIIATDAGREGELVARWILEKAGNKKPWKRLWISSVTDRAILDGFSKLKPGSEYDTLYDAALSRAEADWLVGINATRALTCKHNASLSCGRVQTPTLFMVAKREEEIRKFQPKPYYGIKASLSSSTLSQPFTLIWQEKESGNTRCFDAAKIETILQNLAGKKALILDVAHTAKKTAPPPLYDLTELQRDANKKFGFSAKETLNFMQRLYENHKVLTYPRTDSRYLTTDMADSLMERIDACSVGSYRKLALAIPRKKQPGESYSFIDDRKVSDHHAIIPTEQYVQLDHMTAEERKIYDLVVRRFLCVFYPPCEYEQTTVTACIGTEHFVSKGKVIKNMGWRSVYEQNPLDEEEDFETLPDIKKGTEYTKVILSKTEGKTAPPPPFNEATLLSAMENPIKFMDSKEKEDIKILGDTGGLGTVATRADIIEKLFQSFLLEKRGKDIFITSKAKQLLTLVPEDLKKPELTADWEKKLSQIAGGKLKRTIFMQEIKIYTKELIQDIKTGTGQFTHDNLTRHKCPECGKFLLLVKGKNSTMHICQDRECNYREPLSRTSNARCPNCHKKMDLTGKGEVQTFHCLCGYKEKLTAFQERRKKEGAGVSKKEVSRYLNKLEKEKEPLNNAFADAFAKLDLKSKK